MAVQKPKVETQDITRYVLIAGLVVVAFFGAYRFASARSQPAQAGAFAGATSATTGAVPAANGQAASGGQGAAGQSSGGGCACCGTGASSAAAAPVEGTAKLEGGVQKIYVDVKLQYNPNVIKLKAGVPAEITFSAAQGCTGQVQSADLGFQEDLTTGEKTVKLKGLQPGTYGFSCGMNMVHGQIVVE
jgi:plastocyanin